MTPPLGVATAGHMPELQTNLPALSTPSVDAGSPMSTGVGRTPSGVRSSASATRSRMHAETAAATTTTNAVIPRIVRNGQVIMSRR